MARLVGKTAIVTGASKGIGSGIATALASDGSPFPSESFPVAETLRTGQACSNIVIGVYKPDGALTWISINSEPLFEIACITCAPLGLAQDAHTTGGTRSRVVASHRLPRLDGGQLQVTLVEVTYAPGESSHPHNHPCPVVGYVLEGAVRPDAPARFLAVLTCDHDEPLSKPIRHTGR